MISLEKIKDILRLEDIEGLIDAGAPDDEYDSEAKEIFYALSNLDSSALTADVVLSIISNKWTESFGHEKEDTENLKPYFLEIAHKIIDL